MILGKISVIINILYIYIISQTISTVHPKTQTMQKAHEFVRQTYTTLPKNNNKKHNTCKQKTYYTSVDPKYLLEASYRAILLHCTLCSHMHRQPVIQAVQAQRRWKVRGSYVQFMQNTRAPIAQMSKVPQNTR